MLIFYEVVKGFFFMMTIVLALFLLKGASLFAPSIVQDMRQILLPGYLLFCGIIIGYVIAIFRANPNHHSPDEQNRIYKQAFLMGTMIGLVIALLYIFML